MGRYFVLPRLKRWRSSDEVGAATDGNGSAVGDTSIRSTELTGAFARHFASYNLYAYSITVSHYWSTNPDFPADRRNHAVFRYRLDYSCYTRPPSSPLLQTLFHRPRTRVSRNLSSRPAHPLLSRSDFDHIAERPMNVELALDPSTLVSLASRVAPAPGARAPAARRGRPATAAAARGGRNPRPAKKSAEELDADMAVSQTVAGRS